MAKQDDQCFVLPSQLTVDKIQEVKAQILEFLQGADQQIHCRGNEVWEVDTAGIQVLVALYKTAHKQGMQLTIKDPSPELSMALLHTGVNKVLSVEEGYR